MNKFSFKIDAGQILAKMHLGGCQTHPDVKFFNTGILDNMKGKPDDVTSKSKITFDFDNKAGIYEIGVVVQDEEVKLPNTPGDMAGAEVAEGGKAGGDAAGEDKKDDKAVADKKAAVDKKAGIMDKAEDVDAKKQAAVNEAEKEKLSDEEFKKLQEENRKALNDKLKLAKDKAVKYLQDYMKVFGGEEQSKKITDKNVFITYLPEKESDPYKIKKYKNWVITALTNEEVQKQWDKQLKKKDQKVFTLHNVCFKTAYEMTLKVEK